jgi:hypothetical protein
MEIIPNKPYPTNSRAELRVFDKLRESYINDFSYVALHSLNLTKHGSKRFGEADFVLITKFGVFVLEVKGGGIQHDDGKWYTTNKKGTYSIQDPFRQAETALHAINKEIQEAGKFPHAILPIGYGVIFPDVEWNQKGSEWDRHTVCDLKNLRNFERWLKSFFSYWKSKSANKTVLSSVDLKELKRYLRPNFEIVEPLHEKLSKLEDVGVKLTEDQYGYLDFVAANKRVLCTGGAGTGKTFLAAELARRFGDIDRDVVFICKSNWLRRYLETRIHSEYVTISTIESATVDKRRAGIDKYNILIVDEGQDLFNFDDIEILESLLEGGLKEGEWYIFHDVNNQSGLFVGEDPDQTQEILEYLKDYAPTNIPLTTNCRNTKTILNKVQNTLHLDMGNKGTGIGPEICEFKATTDNASEFLKNEITRLLKDGVPPDSITILSPLSYEKSLVSNLPEQIRNKIIKLDDFSVRSFPVEGISFSEIKDFKGLENEVVIVIDLPDPINIQTTRSKVQHYVAMSRARGLLCVIWNN